MFDFYTFAVGIFCILATAFVFCWLLIAKPKKEADTYKVTISRLHYSGEFNWYVNVNDINSNRRLGAYAASKSEGKKKARILAKEIKNSKNREKLTYTLNL